jgi:hypothetical protein
MVVSGRALLEQRIDGRVTTIPWVRVPEGFEVQPRSQTLRPLPQALLDSGSMIQDILHRVCVVETT